MESITLKQKNFIKFLCNKYKISREMYLKVIFHAIGEFKRLDQMTLADGQNLINTLNTIQTLGTCDPVRLYAYDAERIAEMQQFVASVAA